MSTPVKPVYNPFRGDFDMVKADPAQTVTVAAAGGAQFTTIQAAINSITDNAANKAYVVLIGTGTYVENITTKPYVALVGVGNGPAAPVIVGTITNTMTGTEWAMLNRINHAFTITADSQSALTSSGSFLINDYFLAASTAGDYTYDVVSINHTSAASIHVIFSSYITLSDTYNGSTKDRNLIKMVGTATAQPCNIGQSTLVMNVAALSGDLKIIESSADAPLNIDSNTMTFINSKAAFAGTVEGFCIENASSYPRSLTSNTITLQGTSGGTAYGTCLDSGGNSATFTTNGTTLKITGFTNQYASFVDDTDVQKDWLTSMEGNYTKEGTGLCVITPYDAQRSGFVQWSGAGDYWGYDTGTKKFMVKRVGVGMVRDTPVSWAANQDITLLGHTNGAVNWVYMTSLGVIGTTTTPTAALFQDNIVLFQVWVHSTNFLTVKENHPYSFPTNVSLAWHNLFGCLLQDATQTLAAAAPSSLRHVNVVGTNTLTDHGLDTTILAQTPATWIQFVVETGGTPGMRQIDNATAIIAKYSDGSAGGAVVPNNQFCVYRVGVTKDTITSSAAQFVCVADTTYSGSRPAANTRITSGVVASFPTELKNLEVCQLGYIIIKSSSNTTGAGTIEQVTTALQVFGAAFVAGGTSTSASLITLSIANFDGELSGTESNVQTAMDRLDDYDSLLEYGITKDYRVGNVVKVVLEGFIGNWRCTQLHSTISATFSADLEKDSSTANWEIMSNSEGSRELVNQASHGFAAGDVLYHTGTVYAKANASAASTADVAGIVTGATTNFFVLGKTGKITKTGWGLVAGKTYYLSRTAGALTATPAIVDAQTRVGFAVSTTMLQLNICKGTAIAAPSTLSTRAIAAANWTTSSTFLDNTSGQGDICYAPDLGLLVQVSDGSPTFQVSKDGGLTWETLPVYSDQNWQSLCWSPEKRIFVAVGRNGSAINVVTSSNGYDWTVRTNALDLPLFRSVRWSPELGLFCAVASAINSGADYAQVSSDGITWVSSALPAACYGGGTHVMDYSPTNKCFIVCTGVAGGGTGNLYYWGTDNGSGNLTWTAISGVARTFSCVSWSPELGLFSSVCTEGFYSNTSPDGVTWTQFLTSATDVNHTAIGWSPQLGIFLAAGTAGDNLFAYSFDGVQYTSIDVTPPLASGDDCYCVRWIKEFGRFYLLTNNATYPLLMSLDVGVGTSLKAPVRETANLQNVINPSVDGYFQTYGGIEYITTAIPDVGSSRQTLLSTFREDSGMVPDSSSDVLCTTRTAAGNTAVWLSTVSGYASAYQNTTNTYTYSKVSDGKWHTQALIVDTTSRILYVDGLPVQTETSTLPTTEVTTVFRAASATAANNHAKSLARCSLFNYSLSAEKIKRYSIGAPLDFDDIGGSMTNVLTGDNASLDASIGSWLPRSAYGTFALDTTDMRTGAGCGKYTCIQNGTQYVNWSAGAVAGKRYRIGFWAKSSTLTSTLLLVPTAPSSTLMQEVSIITNPALSATYQYYEFEAKAVDTQFRPTFNAMSTTAPDVVFIDDITIIPLGAIVDWDTAGVSKNVWLDASGNDRHGTVYGAIPAYYSKVLHGDELRVDGNTYASKITGVTYQSKSFAAGTAVSDTDLAGLAFSPDGRKLYVCETGEKLFQCTCATPWDVSTATYDSVSYTDTTPTGSLYAFVFSPDGLKLLMLWDNDASSVIRQYTLTTPWAIATASYASISFSVPAGMTQPRGFHVSPDGLRMYLPDGTLDVVYQYTMTTAWDLSTASKVGEVAIASTTNSAIKLTADGRTMLVLNNGSTDYLQIYSLSTPWDITTASLTTSQILTEDTSPFDIFLRPGGENLYTLGSTNDVVYQYSCTTVTETIEGNTNQRGNRSLIGNDTVYGDSRCHRTQFVDTIAENTSGAGVTADGVLLKDGNITASGAGTNSLTGNTGIGAAAFSDTKLRIGGNPGSAAQVFGNYVDIAFPVTATGTCMVFTTAPSLVAASFTMGTLYHYRAYGASIGSGAALTNQYGYFVDASLTTAGTNYGFYSNIAASGTARYNFYAAGTAPNFFQGPVITGRDTITASAAAAATLTVTGSYQSVAGYTGSASAIQTINGGITGMRVVFRAASDSVDITFESGGNISLAGGASFILDSYLDTIEFIYDGTLTKWLELSRSTNS